MDIKTYLGDSVYAKFDGYMLVVYTDNGDGPRNVIAMEPEVLASLIEFNKRARQQMRDALLSQSGGDEPTGLAASVLGDDGSVDVQKVDPSIDGSPLPEHEES